MFEYYGLNLKIESEVGEGGHDAQLQDSLAICGICGVIAQPVPCMYTETS